MSKCNIAQRGFKAGLQSTKIARGTENLAIDHPLPPIARYALTKQGSGQKISSGSDFSSVLKNAINNLEKTQLESDQAVVDLVTGNTEDFHTPIIAMEKAVLTMDLAVNIRNKVLEAYQEIMRMQI
jgi:flagellar hook-basal body complex protein FliE